MHKTFTTTVPTSLYVESGSGTVTIEAAETTETDVRVEGRRADEVTVEQRGDQIVVIQPVRLGGLFGMDGRLDITVRLPLDSDLATKLGSADLVGTGRLGSVRVKSGSGHVRLDELSSDAVIQCGSGHVEVGSTLGDLRVKTGSGHVQIGRVAGSTAVVSGSGRISVDAVEDNTVAKTGSGDVRIGSASRDVRMTSGSGDLEIGAMHRGAVKAKTASGDVQVGIPAGVPVWTDVSSISGSVRSNLQGAGQPAEGQDHIEIRATTVSGDVILAQL